MAAMPILLAIGSQGSDTGPLWSSCFILTIVILTASRAKTKLLLGMYYDISFYVQLNFSGSNTFGTMKICLRRVVRANEC